MKIIRTGKYHFLRGFFLVEVSVTLLIVSIMLFVFSASFSRALKGIQRIREYNAAATFAKSKMFTVISEIRTSSDTNPKSGTELIDGYTYKWEATFEMIEETEEKIFVLRMKISHEGHNVSEIFTIVKTE